MNAPNAILCVADVSAEHVIGGAERMLDHHIHTLAEAGFAVTVLTRQPSPDSPQKINLAHGIEEHRLAYNGDRGIKGLWQLRCQAKTWWQKHQGRFQAIVAEQPFSMWALQQTSCRLPRLQVIHSFAFEEYATRHGLDWSLKQASICFAMRQLEAQVYTAASRRTVLSQFMQQRLQQFFQQTASIAAGGVACTESIDAEQRQVLRQQFHWQRPTIVSVRNLVPRTGIDLLVQTASILQDLNHDIGFCVIGEGPLKADLQAMAVDLAVDHRIEWLGFVSETERQQRLTAADGFLLPSRALEGFGLVSAEANACGLSVIASPVGANPEVIGSSKDNILTIDSSPEALAQGILSCLEKHSQERRLRLYEHAKQSFSWQQNDQALLQEVKALCP